MIDEFDEDYDVLVVGGGPAGASAAYSAAEAGVRTVLVEKEEEFKDISCAEGIGTYLSHLTPLQVPDHVVEQDTDSMYFSAGDTEIVREGGFYKTKVVDRSEFQEYLLDRADAEGVDIIRPGKLTGLDFTEDYSVEEAVVEIGGEELSVEPSYVIAADGVDSTVGEILGVKEEKERSVGDVYSWEMKNMDIEDPSKAQIYFGDFAPGAYGYIFPKSETEANVGVGSSREGENMEEYFEQFTDEVISSQAKSAERVVERSGKAPIKYTIPDLQYGDFLFAGDAANQNFKPFVEGIVPGIICGDQAGKAVTSKKDYEKLVDKKLGKLFDVSDDVLDKILDIDGKYGDEREDLLNMYLFAYLDPGGVGDLADKEVEDIEEAIYEKNSRLNNFSENFGYKLWRLKTLVTGRA